MISATIETKPVNVQTCIQFDGWKRIIIECEKCGEVLIIPLDEQVLKRMG